ncbi:MAG: DUF1926 domain-containing protein [Candidatus Schekmanbacteria bacterium]|nr:DUF1926 domain-containing protein [Candidatus Schekmanbacteria bacterium]
MEKTYLGFVIHFHQPAGNFDFVIERAYNQCYLPFVNVIADYPDIKMSFHFSGCLLEWLEEKHPEFYEKLETLISRGQIDIMTGGFYEPIMPAIPERDRIGQISMMTRYIKSRFRHVPRGMWLAERVWEPSLPKTLHDAGVKYLILDDTHLKYAGLHPEKIKGYFITEDEGKTVCVFPSDKVLRYSIPFKMPEEIINDIKVRGAESPCSLFSYGDDGEKFGEWPNTYEWVYEKRWLRNFFEALLAQGEWLEVVKLEEYMKIKGPEGRVYIPTASYDEMLEWALPADLQAEFEDAIEEMKKRSEGERYLKFLKGGFWRNFFVKYPEANQMQKRMLYTSNKIAAMLDDEKTEIGKLNKAIKSLYRGQCNCGYWHGVFGGLYSHHIRTAIYKNLVEADKLTNRVLKKKKTWVDVEKSDFNCDGFDEVVISSDSLSLWIDPSQGGSMVEFDWMTQNMNLQNTMSRKREAYHKKIDEAVLPERDNESPQTIHSQRVIDVTLAKNLLYDNHSRGSFIDYVLNGNESIENFIRGELSNTPAGKAFNVYGCSIKKERGNAIANMVGKVHNDNSECNVSKVFYVSQGKEKFKVSYNVTLPKGNSDSNIFAVELNFSLPSACSEGNRLFIVDMNEKYSSMDNIINANGVNSFGMISQFEKIKLKIDVSSGCRLWSFPVKTVSQSERGYDLNYQGTAFLASWNNLSDKKTFNVDFTISLQSD